MPHFPYLALDGIPKGAAARPYQAAAVPTGGFGRQDRNDATASLNVIGMTASEFYQHDRHDLQLLTSWWFEIVANIIHWIEF